MNWFEQHSEGNRGMREVLYGQHLRTAFRLGCNILLLDTTQETWQALEAVPAHERRIDVWWWDDASSRLMLLLAYLMTRHTAWEEATIRVLATGLATASEDHATLLRQKLDEARIHAQPEIVAQANVEAITAYSSDATLLLVPFRLRGDQPVEPFGAPLQQLLERLPVVVTVLAAEDIELDAPPEAGKAGEIAAALDVLADAETRRPDAEKDAAKAGEGMTAEPAELIVSHAVARPQASALTPESRGSYNTGWHTSGETPQPHQDCCVLYVVPSLHTEECSHERLASAVD